MAVNALAQLAQIGGGVPPRAELPSASGMDPNKGYGAYLSSIPNLRKILDPKDGGGGLTEAYTDGRFLYTVMRQKSGGGASMTNDGPETENNAFPVSIHKADLADFYRHEETGEMRARVGSQTQIIHPDTGQVLENNQYTGKAQGKGFKTALMAAAAAFTAGYALTSMAAASAAGGASGATGASGAAGATGAGGTAGAAGSAGGSSLFGGFGTAGPVSGGFSSATTAGSGLGAYGGFGAGATYGGSFAGSMAGLEAAGAAGAASTMGNAGAPAGSGGAPLQGEPPPANPYNPASYLNPQNLANVAGSAMGNGSWTDLIQPAMQLVGGAMQADAAGDAADAMAGAADRGIAENRRQFDTVRELLSPYVNAGNASLTAYQDLTGVNGPDKQRVAMQSLETSPQFASLVKQGENAVLQNASATGGLRGGNVQGALADQRTNILNGLVNQQLGRYMPIVNTGQASAAGVGNAAMSTGNNVAGLMGQAGAAQAGGIVAGTNAITNTLGGIGGFFAGQNAAAPTMGGGSAPPVNLSSGMNFGSGVVQGYSNGGNLF
jgi:hypothetical protein